MPAGVEWSMRVAPSTLTSILRSPTVTLQIKPMVLIMMMPMMISAPLSMAMQLGTARMPRRRMGRRGAAKTIAPPSPHASHHQIRAPLLRPPPLPAAPLSVCLFLCTTVAFRIPIREGMRRVVSLRSEPPTTARPLAGRPLPAEKHRQRPAGRALPSAAFSSPQLLLPDRRSAVR